MLVYLKSRSIVPLNTRNQTEAEDQRGGSSERWQGKPEIKKNGTRKGFAHSRTQTEKGTCDLTEIPFFIHHCDMNINVEMKVGMFSFVLLLFSFS